MTSAPRFRNRKSRRYVNEVDGLNLRRLRCSIQWTAKVRLAMTGELLDAYLADCQWPKKTGETYYGCASTGLLFDKETGACRQSSYVSLLLDTLVPAKVSENEFLAWVKERQRGAEDWFRRRRDAGDEGETINDAMMEDDYAALD